MFSIPYFWQRDIQLFVLPPTCPTVHMEPWTGQTIPTQKNSMTRIPAIVLSRRFELLNMCQDPAHPVAKRITKAIGSPSIFFFIFHESGKAPTSVRSIEVLPPVPHERTAWIHEYREIRWWSASSLWLLHLLHWWVRHDH